MPTEERDSMIEDLRNRLDRVERTNRGWRFCSLTGFAGLVVLGLVAAQGNKGAKRIEAEEIAVLDKDGKKRILFEVTERGPLLTFRPKDGPPRVFMGLGGGPEDSDVPFLNFRSRAGRPSLLMGVSGLTDENESPYLTFMNRRGAPKIRFGMEHDDTPHLTLIGPRFDPKLSLGLDEKGEPFLVKVKEGKGLDALGFVDWLSRLHPEAFREGGTPKKEGGSPESQATK